MSTTGYLDVTPSGGLLQNNSKPLVFTILDENGDAVTGEASNITLYIVEPSGSVTVAGASLTDNGDGSYQYVHEFNEAGWNYYDYLYESGTTKIRLGARIYISARETATAQ